MRKVNVREETTRKCFHIQKELRLISKDSWRGVFRNKKNSRGYLEAVVSESLYIFQQNAAPVSTSHLVRNSYNMNINWSKALKSFNIPNITLQWWEHLMKVVVWRLINYENAIFPNPSLPPRGYKSSRKSKKSLSGSGPMKTNEK